MIFGLCAPACFSAASLFKSHWFVFLQRERETGEVPCGHQLLLAKKKKKRSHVAFFPPHLFFWIDKDFWFRSSSFLPLAPSFTSFPPSLLFHSVYFWHRKIRREREKERGRRRERRDKKKNCGREEHKRGRDSFGVKGEVPLSSFPPPL